MLQRLKPPASSADALARQAGEALCEAAEKSGGRIIALLRDTQNVISFDFENFMNTSSEMTVKAVSTVASAAA